MTPTNRMLIGTFAADQIIYAYTQKKRDMIRKIYKDIAQFVPWSENRRTKIKS